MAEERLIDDDKDRKYKIRKNADGEDELVIDETPDGEDEESDIPVFDIPVYTEDDEDAAVLTPEQLAERDRKKREAEEARAEKLNAAMEKAKGQLDEGDFEAALYTLNKVQDVADGSGDYYCLKLKTLSRNFTDFVSLEECAEVADCVRDYAGEESKAELKELASEYFKKSDELEEATAKLHEENEGKKEERRAVLTERKAKAARNYYLTALPFVVMLVLTIVFSTLMFSAKNGVYLILTIVFAALTVVLLVITLFTARKLLEAKRNLKWNENDKSTRLGREYLQLNNEYELVKQIISSFNDDLS